MKRTTQLIALSILALLAVSGGAATDTQRFDGSYVWEGGDHRGTLEAVFEADGETSWNVDFHFVFNGKAHTYSGTAEGSLSDGALRGEVKNERGNRTFTFRGRFRNGSFSGTHAELEGVKPRRTGTLTLS